MRKPARMVLAAISWTKKSSTMLAGLSSRRSLASYSAMGAGVSSWFDITYLYSHYVGG
ncbi:MAG: hypothetical protein IPJ98_19390 [Bryobacterales bacterium]|nr:hypothetical protein [Bryobacterales bacterium]